MASISWRYLNSSQVRAAVDQWDVPWHLLRSYSAIRRFQTQTDRSRDYHRSVIWLNCNWNWNEKVSKRRVNVNVKCNNDYIVQSVQMREESESRIRKWEGMWFKTTAEDGEIERGQQWRAMEDCNVCSPVTTWTGDCLLTVSLNWAQNPYTQ